MHPLKKVQNDWVSVSAAAAKSRILCFLLKAELPPPYTAIASPDASGVPVINCRVCQSIINLDGKLHQHVVKCTVCNEATVSETGVDKSLKHLPPLFFPAVISHLVTYLLLYWCSAGFSTKKGTMSQESASVF